MKLAAIDIGSNAIRLQIAQVYDEDEEFISFKSLEYLRFPLRLGQDVFNEGKLSQATIAKFGKLMQTFHLLTQLYDVKASFAVATSAMREAENGEDVRNLIHAMTGVDIQIISGADEASILNKAIIPYLSDRPSVHIDVGGGSTEVNLYRGKELVNGRSFKIGTVRKLNAEQRAGVFKEMDHWIKEGDFGKMKNVIGIGTGGNINRLYKLSSRSGKGAMSVVELRALRAYIKAFTLKQRHTILKLNSDRADVIIPAAEIYIHVLERVGADAILVPRVGLKDGIVYELYERTSKRHINQLEYLSNF
ncbi:Ppx/GppA phosphatase family protein [Neolewinella antarctica]|uniref:Exopolyphosphatase/guanosine-5'-triphosphate, 3'-diphosphate pyrophosphatase n=1 Tax=Neolewinella antarctica TaxID=442734 RepID=A0ABX0XHF9_9BACT|nr:phosphatase [Neolewinella antarctica]NJC28324.1 exopolyphosphatase/guanosine-5'-triphosphate,3'-diphosphate pyrophosphatase [Neolewinella antarctica]